MKNLIGVFIILIPAVTYAAWWNPTTWFSTQLPSEVVSSRVLAVPISDTSTSTDCTPQIITKYIPTDTSSQNKLIENLESQISSLQAQLASKPTTVASTPVLTINTTSTEVKGLKNDIAKLTSLSHEATVQITATDADAYHDLIKEVNSMVDRNGDRFFDASSFLPDVSIALDGDGNLQFLPSMPIFIKFINKKIADLNVELQLAEANQ